MKVVALAGGTGSAKLLRGLSHLGSDLTVISNVGDNIWMHGLYICPDVDIAMYTLAGIANRQKGWGVEGDTFETLGQMKLEGEESWFALGDRDLATHILRTMMVREGVGLTEATRRLCRSLGVKPRILPATDSPLETWVRTPAAQMHLQEFWVKQRGRPKVIGVRYWGASKARPTPDVERAIMGAGRVVVCPANPVTSIGPMLAIPGFAKLLSKTPGRVSALSPMVGSMPFSGPAAKLMKGVGIRPDSAGVAEKYSRFLDSIIIDRSDAGLVDEIEAMGIGCKLSDTMIGSESDERRLARELLVA